MLLLDCETEEHPRWNESTLFYGTDDYGFGATPGGFRDATTGVYYEKGVAGRYWEKEHSALSVTVRFILLAKFVIANT